MDAFPDDELEEFIEQVLADWHVPGLSLAVVQDGQVRLCRGYGLRDRSQGLPVTGETLFPIASCTKAFTAMSVGLLVDAGKMDWDRPVKTYLPSFQMYDPYATERITTRDLLSHRSGLPGHDMLWYASNFTRYELLERLRYLEPTCDLRSAFQYQNILYMIVGVLVEQVTGMGWEPFVQAQIFDRLGMTRSNFSTITTRQAADHALPYIFWDGQIHEMPYLEQDGANCGTGSAGDICSCAADLSRWLILLLNGGQVCDPPLISSATFEQMLSPHIFIENPEGRRRYGHEFSSYGLGWTMRSHKGHYLVEHDGMTRWVLFSGLTAASCRTGGCGALKRGFILQPHSEQPRPQYHRIYPI